MIETPLFTHFEPFSFFLSPQQFHIWPKYSPYPYAIETSGGTLI